MARTDEENQVLEQRKNEKNRWKSNIEGDRSSSRTTSTSEGGTTTVTETRQPSTTTTTQSFSISDELRAEADKIADQGKIARGLVKDEKGEWVLANPNVSDLFDMRKSNAEAEKVNRKKAINSAVYQSIATLGDMFTAGFGGNVAKRDKDDTAAKAAADTQARRDKLAEAEIKAKEADRAAREQALLDSQKDSMDFIKSFADRVSKSESSGGEVTRESTAPQTKTTQTTTTQKSPESVKTTPITVHSADGSSTVLNVDESAVQSYLYEVALYLESHASALGLTNITTGEVDEKKVKQMIADGSYYQKISDDLKRKNRMLWDKSLEANTSNLSDEDYLNERHKRIYGGDRGATTASGSQNGRPASAMQYLNTWYESVGMPSNSARNSIVDEAIQSGIFGSMLND